MDDQTAIDLVLGLLGIETVDLGDQAEDFATDVDRQVIRGEDRGVGVGEGEDRDDVEIAPAGLERAAASPAREPRRIVAEGLRGIGWHGGVSGHGVVGQACGVRRTVTSHALGPPGLNWGAPA